MNRDWNDFKALNGNISGAREAFEKACESLFREIYSDKTVGQISVKKGDGGIDVYVGEVGIEPIIVIQCKFFLVEFSEAQHAQIRRSYETAINSTEYELKEWILCIPKILALDETKWWLNWKEKQILDKGKNKDFIQIKMGNELIDLLKQYKLYNKVFQIDDSIKIEEIHKIIVLNTDNKKNPSEKEISEEKMFLFKLDQNYFFKDEEHFIINMLNEIAEAREQGVSHKINFEIEGLSEIVDEYKRLSNIESSKISKKEIIEKNEIKDFLNQVFYKGKYNKYDYLNKSMELIIDNYMLRNKALFSTNQIYLSLIECFKIHKGTKAIVPLDYSCFDVFMDSKRWYMKISLDKDEVEGLLSIFPVKNHTLLTRFGGLDLYDLNDMTRIKKIIPAQAFNFSYDYFNNKVTDEDERLYMNFGGWQIGLA